jgi:hypothetical protein
MSFPLAQKYADMTNIYIFFQVDSPWRTSRVWRQLGGLLDVGFDTLLFDRGRFRRLRMGIGEGPLLERDV